MTSHLELTRLVMFYYVKNIKISWNVFRIDMLDIPILFSSLSQQTGGKLHSAGPMVHSLPLLSRLY